MCTHGLVISVYVRDCPSLDGQRTRQRTVVPLGEGAIDQEISAAQLSCRPRNGRVHLYREVSRPYVRAMVVGEGIYLAINRYIDSFFLFFLFALHCFSLLPEPQSKSQGSNIKDNLLSVSPFLLSPRLLWWTGGANGAGNDNIFLSISLGPCRLRAPFPCPASGRYKSYFPTELGCVISFHYIKIWKKKKSKTDISPGGWYCFRFKNGNKKVGKEIGNPHMDCRWRL